MICQNRLVGTCRMKYSRRMPLLFFLKESLLYYTLCLHNKQIIELLLVDTTFLSLYFCHLPTSREV